MKPISFNFKRAMQFVPEAEVATWQQSTQECIDVLHNGSGKGSDFLGWLRLPSSIRNEELIEIENAAKELREQCEIVVVVGIGGSYLGSKAVIEAVGSFYSKGSETSVLFAGQNISEDYLYELLAYIDGSTFGIINISKSGTTTEPAIAFRVLKKALEDAVGKEAARSRIVTVTDHRKGALRTLTDREGYKSFVIPDSVGGRFSVFTPVGLLPIAVAGFNIRELISGARSMEKQTGKTIPFDENIAAQYAAVRHSLYKQGKKIEILANFEPKLHYVAEWWKQLYGESEGKDNKGIFPAAVDFSSDLHSMGQWIQEGERSIFETVISVEKPLRRLLIPKDKSDLDGLNFLAGKRIHEVNRMAELGVKLAHQDGGVPILEIEAPALTEYSLGQLLYFFEKACGISGYLLKVNPFNQPGVEEYKKNMFALLEKPGFEKESAAIKARLQ